MKTILYALPEGILNLHGFTTVPTCGMEQSSGHRMRRLPRHPELAHRWLQAIEIGCQQQNIPWVRENWISAEICDDHFDEDNPLCPSGGYLEPSRFYNSSGEALSVTSCRLCLQFYQHNEVTDYTDYMTLRSPELFSLRSINKLIAPSKNLSKFICLECVAKLDILESVLLFFDHSYKYFESLEASLNLMNHDRNLKSENGNGLTAGSLVEEDRQLELELSEVMIKGEIPDDETNNFLQKTGIAMDATIIKTEGSQSVESASRFKNYGYSVENNPKETESFSCSECDQCFATKYNLKRHRWFIHSASKKPSRLLMFECELCKTKHMRLSELDSHIKHDHGGEEYPYLSCKDCTKTFSCRTKLTRHSLCHTATGKNRCDICNKLFVSRYNMLLHKRQHNNERKYKCEICHQKYTTKEILKYHQKTHTEELNFECLYCDKKFTLKSRLDDHTAMHHMGQSFKCDICRKSFITEKRLKIHRQTHRDELLVEQRISFGCNECGKKISSNYQMKIQQANVHSERPFACQICGKRFGKNNNLRTHMALHNNERKFECDICHKTFKTKRVLKIHIERHSDERKFGCNMCGKALKTKSCLLRHIKIHTNERKFECEHCGKKFKTKDCLGSHYRVTCGPIAAFQL
ncbi:oocyte zinc finger protein XlCOF22-like [Uranotaenia lowii]|uniref:oocyte zinc finger protein XlCOF22-like n=1 Tax=Uranotaenia lowii TaxID=190385 RepID=UPI0024791009|nr:oocyte zinc finger protein XlCOF22-like [Uranotaenia lowii]